MGVVLQIRVLPVLFALALLAGCSTVPKFSGSELSGNPVRVDNLYVYSFLDVMQDQYGAEFLRLTKIELGSALNSEKIRHAQLWSRDAGLSGAALATNQTADYRSVGQSTFVPVKELISANASQEREFGTDYRLLIFPSRTSANGTGYDYYIQWVLADARVDRVVWKAESHLETFVWFSTDENAYERAAGFVDGLIAEWRRLGLVR